MASRGVCRRLTGAVAFSRVRLLLSDELPELDPLTLPLRMKPYAALSYFDVLKWLRLYFGYLTGARCAGSASTRASGLCTLSVGWPLALDEEEVLPPACCC